MNVHFLFAFPTGFAVVAYNQVTISSGSQRRMTHHLKIVSASSAKNFNLNITPSFEDYIRLSEPTNQQILIEKKIDYNATRLLR